MNAVFATEVNKFKSGVASTRLANAANRAAAKYGKAARNQQLRNKIAAIGRNMMPVYPNNMPSPVSTISRVGEMNYSNGSVSPSTRSITSQPNMEPRKKWGPVKTSYGFRSRKNRKATRKTRKNRRATRKN